MCLLRLLGDVRVWSRLSPGVSGSPRYMRVDALTQDVVLFEHRRPRFFRLLGIFCGAQVGFWAYLAHFGFTSLRDTREKSPQDGQEGQGRNLGSPLWRAGFTLSCLTVGSLIMAAGLLFSRRSVSAVTLHKGGELVTITTASLLGTGSSFSVPLRHISCMAHRSEVPAMIPFKVKGRPLYYLLDKNGRITNAKLFDITVGAYRKL
ncbi:transmembrane protein 223 [Bombina bombina]|uniref:transmembrane protein 223 n=1 Tax=Bombina bombina TaxID=8345 RepID=UPI00235A6787|nr:transmembrane protein 223 [Bombina bombina]